MSVVEDLKAARQHVELGWTQGKLHRVETNSVCAMGAVSLAAGMRFGSPCSQIVEWDRHQAMYDELMKHIPSEFFDVAAFNDAETTTQRDVLDLFDKALAELGGLAA
jgi:hypothetical protein